MLPHCASQINNFEPCLAHELLFFFWHLLDILTWEFLWFDFLLSSLKNLGSLFYLVPKEIYYQFEFYLVFALVPNTLFLEISPGIHAVEPQARQPYVHISQCTLRCLLIFDNSDSL